MISSLKSRRYDVMMANVWPNAPRARHANFTNPMFYSVIEAFVRAGDKRFDQNVRSLDRAEYTIATIDGEMSSNIANEEFPQARVFSLPHTAPISQLLENVATGKADISFAEKSVVNDYMHNNPGKIKTLKLEKPIRIFSNAALFPAKEPDLLNMFNNAQDQLMLRGFVDEILEKYGAFDDFYPVAVPYKARQ